LQPVLPLAYSNLHRELQPMTTTSVRSIRAYRTAGVLVAAVILLLPPLVRATARIGDGRESPTAVRLNRGFDVPLSKWKMSPPVAVSFEQAPLEISTPSHGWQSVADFEVLSESQHHRSPDPLRGPPLI
jgi:hypothetical protein